MADVRTGVPAIGLAAMTGVPTIGGVDAKKAAPTAVGAMTGADATIAVVGTTGRGVMRTDPRVVTDQAGTGVGHTGRAGQVLVATALQRADVAEAGASDPGTRGAGSTPNSRPSAPGAPPSRRSIRRSRQICLTASRDVHSER
ncbi:MAG TPA: hypothetical protein VFC82_02840 [Actinomycetaceae bacterium]|nr:hypothetical protein [Actinomycetaceae bacterium]